MLEGYSSSATRVFQLPHNKLILRWKPMRITETLKQPLSSCLKDQTLHIRTCSTLFLRNKQSPRVKHISKPSRYQSVQCQNEYLYLCSSPQMSGKWPTRKYNKSSSKHIAVEKAENLVVRSKEEIKVRSFKRSYIYVRETWICCNAVNYSLILQSPGYRLTGIQQNDAGERSTVMWQGLE